MSDVSTGVAAGAGALVGVFVGALGAQAFLKNTSPQKRAIASAVVTGLGAIIGAAFAGGIVARSECPACPTLPAAGGQTTRTTRTPPSGVPINTGGVAPNTPPTPPAGAPAFGPGASQTNPR